MPSSVGGARGKVAYSDRANRAGRRGSDRRDQSDRRFFLYVEGPRDCEILRSWARSVSRPLERAIDRAAVILGGRQPARAIEHFRREAQRHADARGLCVLDRDDGAESAGVPEASPELEFFTWPRRHIESYLLVPAAIQRSLNGSADGVRVERLLEEYLPSDQSPAGLSEADAKRLLAPQGPISRELGQPLSTSVIAHAMRADEIHPEIHELFRRVSEGAGLSDPALAAAARTRPSGGR